MQNATIQTNDRDHLIHNFLIQQNIQNPQRKKIDGDASFRRYERIYTDGITFILMDAPPDKEDVKPFITVSKLLLEQGFSTPRVIAKDHENGLLLLEDFGDKIFRKLLLEKSGEPQEAILYKNAIDALTKLRSAEYDNHLTTYSDAKLLNELNIFTEWYLPNVAKIELTPVEQQYFTGMWHGIFAKTRQIKECIVLRDYHADNLIWLGERKGYKRVGILDFQDAVIGSPAYDLVSLLQDARRDIPQELAKDMMHYYLKQNPDLDEENFREIYAILGAQRNLKIIGIFARLAYRDGKDKYLKMIPRVWDYLMEDLKHPSLESVRNWVDSKQLY